MADIALDYEKIEATSKALDEAADTINPMLSTLQTKVSTLLEGGLVFRQSSPAMEEAYNKFNTNLTGAIEGIKGFAKQFREIKSQLDNMDSEWAKNIRSSGN
ncbi:hypothetical protein AB0K60_20455 [Thermopolyspora sp. NPDC052614]|uniref:hypothetical protein n=1 Tax=Thermopolyspora sp. NPDC052614 TaxID=3155682 RepID=UPI00341FFA6C